MDEVQLKQKHEQTQFFQLISSNIDTLPSDVAKYKILPIILESLTRGAAGAPVIHSVFKLGKNLPADEYQSMIVPCIVKLYASPDRQTRVKLQDNLAEYIDHLSIQVKKTPQ